MKTIYILLITVLSWSLQACTAQCGKPDACTDSIPRIYPDYAGVTFPLNIAPPNFRMPSKRKLAQGRRRISSTQARIPK